MSKLTKQQETACDIAVVCLTFLSILKEMELSPAQIGIHTLDGVESLADVMARLRDATDEMVMDDDEDSKEVMASLLAKVGGAA